MKLRRILPILLVTVLLASAVWVAEAAPTGKIAFPNGATSADNVLYLSGSGNVSILFKNDAGAAITDVASTLQYIALAAADLNPTRVTISTGAAYWKITDSTGTIIRTSGTVAPSLNTSAIYSPYSNSQTVYEYVWALGAPNSTLIAYTASSQFNNALKILRPGEILNITITEQCLGNVGDSVIWFYFRATEAAYASGSYPADINTIPSSHRVNLYYSKLPGSDQTPYWLPLHNSYDPHDPDIGTGHGFQQTSWTRSPTTNAFAKSNKTVHQQPSNSFHICGLKFNDINNDGFYQPGLEFGMNGATVTLLGADALTKAELYYPGMFTYPAPDSNPMTTGENNLLGAYCFNMANIAAGTYTFYVKLTEPAGWTNTTSQIIGPITLVYPNGPFDSFSNNFGNIRTAVYTSYTTTISTGSTSVTTTVYTGITSVTSTVYMVSTSYTGTTYLVYTSYTTMMVSKVMVGGTIATVNRLTVLAPYIFMIGCLIAALIFIASRKRKS